MIVDQLPKKCLEQQCPECEMGCFWSLFLLGLKTGEFRRLARERRFALGLAPDGEGERREAGVGDAPRQ